MESNTKFSSRLGFMAAAASSAVGLGSIWRFPYEAGQYGGALFLLLYVGFTAILGLPLMMMEVAFGRQRHGGTHRAFRDAGAWRGLGMAGAVGALVYVSFYNVIIGWVLGYAWRMVCGELSGVGDFSVYFQRFSADVPSNLVYTALVTLLVAWVIRSGVQAGIERYSKVLMPLFAVLLLGLIGYGVMLPGATQGLRFYLTPRWADLSARALFKALSLSFMTLSIGQGILTTYGAYLRREDDLVQSTFVVVCGVVGSSFLSGLLVFPLVFHGGMQPAQGTGLVFVVLPWVFQQFSWGIVLGGLFFLLLLFAALTSSLSLMEVVTNHVMERWGVARSRAVLGIALVIYGLSIPSVLSFGGHAFFTRFWVHGRQVYSFLDTLSLVVLDLGSPCIALLLCIFVGRRWRAYAMAQSLRHGSMFYPRLTRYVYFVTRYLAPLIIGFTLLQALRTLAMC